MRHVVSVLSLGLFALTLGCEARVSLGAECVGASECPSGLSCVAGRCRAACGEVRDCASPFACVLDARGAGSCAVLEDESCGAGCVAPLVCDGGRCVQRCDGPHDCAAGLACTDGSCARPTTTPCDLLGGGGCEAGRRCAILAGGEIGCQAITVREEDMLALHEPCGPTDTCEAGLACAGGRCVRVCLNDGETGEPLTSCGLGSRCTRYDEVGEPVPSASIGYCTEPCDPVTQTGCSVREHRCDITFAEPLRQSTCRYGDVACDGEPGDPRCALGDPSGGCAPGHFPLHYLHGSGAVGVLEELCLEACDDDGDCVDGFRCFTDAALDIEDLDGRARRIGACLPACEAGACGPAALTLGLACEPSGRFCTAGCMIDTDCYPALRCASGRCTPRVGG